MLYPGPFSEFRRRVLKQQQSAGSVKSWICTNVLIVALYVTVWYLETPVDYLLPKDEGDLKHEGGAEVQVGDTRAGGVTKHI